MINDRRGDDDDTEPDQARIDRRAIERDRRSRAFLWTLILVCTAIFLATEIAIYLHFPRP